MLILGSTERVWILIDWEFGFKFGFLGGRPKKSEFNWELSCGNLSAPSYRPKVLRKDTKQKQKNRCEFLVLTSCPLLYFIYSFQEQAQYCTFCPALNPNWRYHNIGMNLEKQKSDWSWIERAIVQKRYFCWLLPQPPPLTPLRRASQTYLLPRIPLICPRSTFKR